MTTTDQTPTTTPPACVRGERADILESLRRHRDFLRFTVRDISDDQARQRTTVSELTLGGLIKHVATTEKQWAAHYDSVARATDALVESLPDLDASHPLPEAPWFEPGARWSARRSLMHILAETSQHAGHADIIREALDGQKTMA